VRKSLIIKSIILVICLGFLALLPPATGDLLGKDNPPGSRFTTLGPNGHPRPTLDMVALQVPR